MNRERRRVAGQQGGTVTRGALLATQAMFSDALDHHQAGRTDEAERLYRQVLARDPRHADSLHLLGVVAHQAGRNDAAVDLIRKAIAGNAGVAFYHSNLGNALRELQRLDEAVAAFSEALRLQPHCLEAHVNLGNTLLDQGKLDEAVASYGRAIALKPDLAEAHNNLGNAHKEAGRPDAAIASYRRAIECQPAHPEAYLNLGGMFLALGRLDEAVAACLRALALKPDYAEALVSLGNALREQERLDEAAICFCKALALKPDYAAACNNLGNVLRERGQLDEAVACCIRAINLAPGFLEAHVTLGSTLRELGRLDEAVACFHKALEIKPDYPGAHNNLGIALRQQGLLDPAVACYRRAIALDPDDPDAHLNLGTALLALGDMAAGWVEFEWRWKTPLMAKERRRFAQPQWHGEAAAGQTLLVHAEQGFGDTLQFCRYAPLAAARGLRVILEAPKPLVRLLRGLPGIDRVVGRGDDLPAFDLHCPMLSMPLALGTTLATIPSAASYLSADAAQAAAWQARVAATGGQGLRVGLVWAGSPRNHSPALAAVDRRRSLPPERLSPLFEVPGVQFFSLQKGGPAAPADVPLIDLMAEVQDFADTAALIANLDLVISVDTAVAHLAAALGKPVWVLDRSDPCWRWLTGRRDSPWYPTLRLYRQPHPGDWDSVLAAVVHDLRCLASA
ncbi:MAG: tetratricopeptide repeat protein [Acetobacteraceae bacterium]